MNCLRARASRTAKWDSRLGSSLSPVTEIHISLVSRTASKSMSLGLTCRSGAVGLR